MKNHFAEIRAIMLAWADALQENKLHDRGFTPQPDKSIQTRVRGPANPAGSKMLRGIYRQHHKVRGTYQEAINWYHLYTKRFGK